MTLDSSLIGHGEALARLDRLIATGRFPGSLLLAGPPGIGKGTLVERLAGRLLSAPAGTDGHPDVLRIVPQEDLAMRQTLAELLHHVHERPLRAARRVVILEAVDRLSPDAASLLLKAIEDCPPFANFLLTCELPDRVPATVRSRSDSVLLPPVPDAELVRGLRERGVAAAQAERIARLAGGRPGLALRLAADARVREQYEQWEHALSAADQSFQERSRLAADLESAGDAEAFLVFLQSRVRKPPISPTRLRRSREALAMLRQHVPARLVLEYVLV